jgi:cell volume regulation protein A
MLIGAGLVLISVLVSPLSTRLGAPILLVFLAIGMLMGQDGPGGLEFNDFDLAYQIGSIALAWLINRLPLANGLFAVMALAAALALFSGTQLLGGSGYLAVYLCGLMLIHRMHGERRVESSITHDSLAWLSQILMFLMLGLLVTPHELLAEASVAAGVAFILIFIARPLAVAVSLAPFSYSLRERVFISWVGLLGAVPIFLAIIPVVSPGPIDTNFFNIVFMVVIASLVLQGWSIPWLASRLGLEAGEDEQQATAD